MNVLSSMTNATPETRLMLITWAARFGMSFQTGASGELGVSSLSKRHVKEALEYLVREGYFWQARSLSSSELKVKTKDSFDYGLTTECWRLWCESLDNCPVWAMEICHLLANSNLTNSAFRDSSNPMKVSMLLVWTVLVSKANQAGYVVGFESLELQKILGMPRARINRSILALVKAGFISLAANCVARSVLLDPLKPIYKIHPKRPDKKTIKLGVDISGGNFTPFRFISSLQRFYNSARATKKNKLPLGDIPLSYEQYYELSKIFSHKKLATAIHHLCLSTIFSLVPKFADTYSDLRKTNDAALPPRTVIADLRKWVHQALVTHLASDLQDIEDLDSLGICQTTASKNADFELLRRYTLLALNNELVEIIMSLSKRWITWALRCEVTDAKLIGHMPSVLMISNPSANEVTDTSDSEEQRSKDIWLAVYCVLEAYVPNDKKIGDSMVHNGVLYCSKISLVKSS
jgi:hypothetical protein